MGGGNTTTTNTTQNQQTGPWSPAVPQLSNILGQLANGGAALTPEQAASLQGGYTAAGSIPNFGGAVANTIPGILNTTPQLSALNTAYNTFQGANAPYLNPNFTNPMTNPAMSNAMNSLNQQITQSVDSQFAGAGRTGDNGQLAKAIAQGESNVEAPMLANEYTTLTGQQQNAINSGLAGAGTYATEATAIPGQAATTGAGVAGALPGLYMGPTTAQLGIANMGYNLPYQNTQTIEQLLNPIAGLGSTGTLNQQGTTTQQLSLLSTLLGAGFGGLGLAGAFSKA